MFQYNYFKFLFKIVQNIKIQYFSRDEIRFIKR